MLFSFIDFLQSYYIFDYFNENKVNVWCVIQIILLMPKKTQESQSDDCSQQENEKVQIRKPKIDRIDKIKNLKKIAINVSMTQYPVVSQVAQELGWKVQQSNDRGDWDVYWTDFAIDPDILIKMHLFQKINHYPGIHVIARKNLLGLSLMSLRQKLPQQYNFFPLTWMLPTQYAEFRTYYEEKPKGKTRTYIAKPEADCQGRGIFLTRNIEDLEPGKHYVIQRYMARPYLLDGLKFDLRIYVLLCGTNPLRLYMFNQGLARFATQPYVQPNSANLQKQYMHLTNYAINKNNPKFVFNNSSNNMGVGHKRSLSCVYKQLASKGIDIDKLKRQINDITIKTLITGLPLMSHQYRCSQPEDYSGNMCFHILGLDIMLNSKAEPVLLQVNHTPSFTTDTPLDHKIKHSLIKDTLKLMNINSKVKNQLYNKVKQLNKDRLLTGKRQIYQGQQRQNAIDEAQALRNEYEDRHLGGFQRIFPLKDQGYNKKYNQILEVAQKTFVEESGSVRMKLMQKEAQKLLKDDTKAMKKASPSPLKKTQSISKAMGESEKHTGNQSEVPMSDSIQSGFNQVLSPETLMNEFAKSLQLTGSCSSPPKLNKELIRHSPHSKKQQSLIKMQAIQPHPIQCSPIQSIMATPSKIHKALASELRKDNTLQTKRRVLSNTVARSMGRPIKSKNIFNQLPHIVDNLISNNQEWTRSPKKKERAHTNKGEGTDKIYKSIAQNIRELTERKTGNGTFLMPKVLNFNWENPLESRGSAFRGRIGNLGSGQ